MISPLYFIDVHKIRLNLFEIQIVYQSRLKNFTITVIRNFMSFFYLFAGTFVICKYVVDVSSMYLANKKKLKIRKNFYLFEKIYFK